MQFPISRSNQSTGAVSEVSSQIIEKSRSSTYILVIFITCETHRLSERILEEINNHLKVNTDKTQ